MKQGSIIQRLVEWIKGSEPPPPGTLGGDYRRWQDLQGELKESRGSLTGLVEATRMAAREAGIPQPEKVGLVALAMREVDTLYPRKLMELHESIKATFDILNHHCRNRTPEPLSRDLKKYEILIEQRRQQYQELHRRLTLIQTLFQKVAQHNPWTKSLPLPLLMEHPDIFQTIMDIKLLHWRNQQIFIKRLRNGFQNRLIIGEKWNVFLKNYITSYSYRLGQRILNELRHQFHQNINDDINVLKTFHKRLDTPMLNYNRKAVEKLIKMT